MQQPSLFIDGVAAIVEDNIVLKSDLNQMVNMMAIQRGVNPNENFELSNDMQVDNKYRDVFRVSKNRWLGLV